MKNVTERLSYANVAATLALFIALSLGSAYAADKIGSKDIAKKAVKSKHIKNKGVKAMDLDRGAVKATKLGRDAVHARKVLDGSLLAADFAPGQLPQGEQGPTGDQGPTGPKGDPGEPATRLFASVRNNGDLTYGQGATDSLRNSDGLYTVTFDRSLVNCVAVGNVGSGNPPSPGSFFLQGILTVSVGSGADNQLVVRTVVDDDTAAEVPKQKDSSFLIAVFC